MSLEIGSEFKPERELDIVWKRFGYEIVTLNKRTRQYHVLNAAASIIFEMATGENNTQDIAQEVAELFQIDTQMALTDTLETVSGMQKMGLILTT
jgi:hypothetical protein